LIEDVSKVLECEAALPLTALIGPNIIIDRSFDSPEAAIAMNFVRATGVQGRKIAPEKRIYATLAVSGEALINTEELLRFLKQLIVLETPPDGFYVLVAAGIAEARADLFNASRRSAATGRWTETLKREPPEVRPPAGGSSLGTGRS
jgi:hypothetical protein